MAKRFKQFRLNCGSGSNNIGFSGSSQYSNNLLTLNGTQPVTAYELAIYARPGTRFKANAQNLSGEDWEFTVNALGVFQMEMCDNPITGLFVYSADGTINNLGPIIIDVICMNSTEGEEV